ncbi:uncharacterized protein LOC128556720 [Mercenaria mercenaria]|uniref:uncharacterized protein LOC128556720 n=1 Tax=Mercenaria mercenaria TaxID=6596 RepID=UPI00234F74E8|nr:uncharacterized protein LOC128556720 [Mercenaria mercenaria]
MKNAEIKLMKVLKIISKMFSNSDDSANIFSVREVPMHSRQETPHDADIDVSVSGNCSRNMGIQHENQSCVSSHGHKDVSSLEQANVGEPLNSGRRASNTDVNRGGSKGKI